MLADIFPSPRKESRKNSVGLPTGDRGLLSNYPPDVIAVVNGRPVTTGDMLDGKRRRQRRRLERIRRPVTAVQKPGFVHVFCNHGWFPYGGWWLYIHTSTQKWSLDFRRWGNDGLINKTMSLFPCGLLPMKENFRMWKPRFAEAYHRPTAKRPTDNALALVRVTVSADSRTLLGVERWE